MLFYRIVLSPALHSLGGVGFGCRFSPTCSCYAETAFQTHGFFAATALVIRRLLRCHPWSKANYFDPVPTSQSLVERKS